MIMRKKIFTQSLLLIAMLFSGVSSWADDVAYKTLTFSSETNGQSIGNYTATWNATIDGFTWTLKNFNNNNNNWEYVKCGRKNNESVGTITTASKIDKAITKVVVTVDAVKADYVNSSKLYVADDAEFSSNLQTIDIEIDEGDNTFTVTNPTANSYYKLEFDCASASANGIVTISKIVYYTNDGGAPTPQKTEAGLAFEKDTYETNVGESFMAPSLTNPNNLDVTYESSNTDVATVDAGTGVVTIKAAGSTIITASSIETDTYKAGEASYTLKVIDPNANDGSAEKPFTVAEAIALITSPGFESGNYYVKGIISRITSTSKIETEGVITYYISDDGTTTNELQVYKGKRSETEDFTSADEIAAGDEVTVYGPLFLYNNNTPEINVGNYIVSLTHTTKVDPELSFGETTVFNLEDGDIFDAPTLTTAAGFNGTVTYTSSNTNVAEVDAENGKITLTGAFGNAKITATSEATDKFTAGSASYTINVKPSAINASDNGTIVFGELNLENGVQYSVFNGGTIKVTFAGGGNDGKYYDTGEGIRIYGDGTMTITALDNAHIGKIKITYSGNYKPEDEDVVNVGTYDVESGVWTGYAQEVVFTRPTGSGHWRIQKIEAITKETVTVTEAGWASYVTECNVEIPADKAYVVSSVENGWAKLTNVTAAPAGTPLLINGEGTVELKVAESAAPITNQLKVSDGTAQENIYVLAEKNSKVGFYKWAGGALSEGKVYLPVPANAREFIGISFEATGINTAKAAETNGMVYNLQGQRVVKAQKGLYIVNGKKVIKN